MKSFVYCFRLGEYVKIGLSTDPMKRLRQLQTSLPHDLIPLYMIQTDDAKSLEKKMHDAFAHLSARREWFNYSKEIDEAFIANGASKISELPDASAIDLDFVEAKYRAINLDEVVLQEVEMTNEFLSYPMFADEEEWVKSKARKFNKIEFQGSRAHMYAATISDCRDEVYDFDNKTNKAKHLNYRFDSDGGEYDFYHKSSPYMLGVVFNKFGLKKRSAMASLVAYSQARIDDEDLKPLIFEMLVAIQQGASLEDVCQVFYHKTGIYHEYIFKPNETVSQ